MFRAPRTGQPRQLRRFHIRRCEHSTTLDKWEQNLKQSSGQESLEHRINLSGTARIFPKWPLPSLHENIQDAGAQTGLRCYIGRKGIRLPSIYLFLEQLKSEEGMDVDRHSSHFILHPLSSSLDPSLVFCGSKALLSLPLY